MSNGAISGSGINVISPSSNGALIFTNNPSRIGVTTIPGTSPPGPSTLNQSFFFFRQHGAGNPWASSSLATASNPYMMANPYGQGYGYYPPPYPSMTTSGYVYPSQQTSGTAGAFQQLNSALTSYTPAPADASTQATPLADVSINDDYFEPKSITVTKGTTVRWINRGQHLHTVKSNKDLWDSHEIDPGKVFSLTFMKPGTYGFHCILQPEKMRGVINVTD
jgi:plastocyanin